MLRAIAGAAAAGVLLAGCEISTVATGETRRETQAIELDKSEAVRVEISMAPGELDVKSGTPKLLEADFSYNVPEWKPTVDYRAGAGGANLIISQPRNSIRASNAVNTWMLNLNSRPLLDVTANLDVGEANLELGQMNLRSVTVNVGVGEVKMDLRGEPKRDYNVQIHGGVGEATVYLPKDVGISARATGGIGEIRAEGLEKRDGLWINPDRVNAPVTVRLDVKGGVGEIRLVR
jgi:hypothetical protein